MMCYSYIMSEKKRSQFEELSDEELAEAGISQTTIRLSIGTEHIDDIIADLEKGFAAIK